MSGGVDVSYPPTDFQENRPVEPSDVTQQFAGSFSKVPLHLAKLPLKVLLCEVNFRPLLFSVCGQSVSTSLLNNSTKFQGQQSRCSQEGIVFV